jgi:hypothetical protein
MSIRTRWCIQVLAFVAFLSGCPRQDKEPPLWDQVKITDLATKDQASTGLNTADLDIYVFQVPTERVKGLRGLWDALNSKPFRYRNYRAFRSNAFRVAKGTHPQWDWIAGSLIEAGASKGATVSLWLSGDQEDDVTLTALGSPQKVTFMDKEGQSQQVTIGPGRLVLRLKVEQGSPAPQTRQLVAYPVFTCSTGGAIPELAAMTKAKDVAFLASAFSTPIREGDIVVLGPEDYYGGLSTLGGLFFCDPQGRLAVDSGRPNPVRIKQTVRVYVIVCTRLSEESP